jgi:GNAT superfamily N-acetyltransferase
MKLQLQQFSQGRPSAVAARALLAEASILRKRVLCEELGWRSMPAQGHEMDAHEAAAGHVLARVGDAALGYARWRLVDPSSTPLVHPADPSRPVAAGAQPVIDRLLVVDPYRGLGFGLVLLSSCLADVLHVGTAQAPGGGRVQEMTAAAGLPAGSAGAEMWTEVRCYLPSSSSASKSCAWLQRQGFCSTGRVFEADPTGLCEPRAGAAPGAFHEFALPITAPAVRDGITGVFASLSARGYRMPCTYDRLLRDGDDSQNAFTDGEEEGRRRPDPITKDEEEADEKEKEDEREADRQRQLACRVPGEAVKFALAERERRKAAEETKLEMERNMYQEALRVAEVAARAAQAVGIAAGIQLGRSWK